MLENVVWLPIYHSECINWLRKAFDLQIELFKIKVNFQHFCSEEQTNFEICTSWNRVNKIAVLIDRHKRILLWIRTSLGTNSWRILWYVQCALCSVDVERFMCGHSRELSERVKSFSTTAKITFAISIGLPSFSK